MSSAGHILDMINRMKQNKQLRKKKKFKGDNRKNSYSESFASATEYDFPNWGFLRTPQFFLRKITLHL